MVSFSCAVSTPFTLCIYWLQSSICTYFSQMTEPQPSHADASQSTACQPAQLAASFTLIALLVSLIFQWPLLLQNTAVSRITETLSCQRNTVICNLIIFKHGSFPLNPLRHSVTLSWLNTWDIVEHNCPVSCLCRFITSTLLGRNI